MTEKLIAICIFSIVVLSNHFLAGQVVDPKMRRPAIHIIARLGKGEMVQPQQSDSRDGVNASLKTDPELEAILEKAERFRKEKQYGIASKLWQSVLERSGDALYSSNGDIYFSLSQQVEAVLASLPVDEGLSTYRISADANAKAILAEAGDPLDENALRLVVRKYFLSSIGDDAALTLSSIYMDQFDFVGAYRMLAKIANGYPDPSVSLVDVNVRMALCQAMMGEEANAVKAIEQAKELTNGIASRNLDSVEQSIPSLIQQKTGKQVEAGFGMALANRSRNGIMPALSSRYLENDLQAVWQYYFLPKTIRWADLKRIKPILGEDALEDAEESVTREEEAMVARWRKQLWQPSGDLVFDGDRVYFKTSVDLSVWNRKANDDEVVWRPLWRNKYQMDDSTMSTINIQSRLGRGSATDPSFAGKPNKSYEVQLFFDRISSQMAIQDGVLYNIEGGRFDSTYVNYQSRRNSRMGVNYRRSRTNHLTAYEAATGKLLWTLPREIPSESKTAANLADAFPKTEVIDDVPVMDDGGEESTHIASGGFMSTPIFYGGMLIAAVNHSGAIWAYGLDPENEGQTIWRSYLCDEPESGANPNAPINLSIEGSDLFASCGLGVVFILDPTTGLIRFAKPYPRTGTAQTITTSGRWRVNTVNRLNFGSWLTDTVIPFGRQMVCFSSDARHIQALDRNTGKIIWQGESHPLEAKVDYVIGVHEDILYAGGRETILAFNLADEGRMVWGGKKLFNDEFSYGRGMVTDNGVFIPVEDKILLYSLDGSSEGEPQLLKTIKVQLGTGAPVGNLYSDGDKIWVHGANRVYALGPREKS